MDLENNMNSYFSLPSERPVRVQQQFYNDFYALRLKVSIEGHIVKLDSESKVPNLYCDPLDVQAPFYRLLNHLRSLLFQYGVSDIVSCFSDPLPLLQICFDQPEDTKQFLLHIKDISPRIWLLVWDGFTAEATNIGLSLSKDEEDDTNDTSDIRLQHIYRSENNSCLQLLYFSPDYSHKEVKIVHVTLSNCETITQMASSSIVFDIPFAIDLFLHDKSPQAIKGKSL